MEKGVARVGKDRAESPLASGAKTVLTNDVETAFEGSLTVSGNTVIKASTTVFAENKPMARMGDETAKGTPILTGSTNVFADDNNIAAIVIVENDTVDDGTPAGQTASIAHLNEYVQRGILDPGIVQRTNSATAQKTDTTPGVAIPGTAQACGQIHSMTTFPLDLKLSKYFTLENMLKKWLDGNFIQFPQHKLQINKGFSIDQIVCNLSLLCQNVLDPLWEYNTDWRITNSFREGSNQAQHGNGQAVDLVLNVRNKENLYKRAQWMRDNLPYDQLLLEYRDSIGPNGKPYIQNWIHVSFTGNNIYRNSNGSGPKGCRGVNDPNKIGTLYNDVWKFSRFQLY